MSDAIPGALPLQDQFDNFLYVRVTGVRRDRFVEFQFSLGGPDLLVDLVLPYPAFRDFCADNKTVALPVDTRVQMALDRLGDRTEASRREPPAS